MIDTAPRQADLRHMLYERRREIRDEVRSHIRGEGIDRPSGVRDDLERSDVHVQREITVALVQMRADALARIDESLVRLDAGHQGAVSRVGPRFRRDD